MINSAYIVIEDHRHTYIETKIIRRRVKMEVENCDELFEKPFHKEVNCPWYTEDYFGHNHPCEICEDNEILWQDIQHEADLLIESGKVGTKNTENWHYQRIHDDFTEALNIVIRKRKEEAGYV